MSRCWECYFWWCNHDQLIVTSSPSLRSWRIEGDFFFDQDHLITISSGFLKISANFCKVWTLSCLCETLANGCDLSSWPYTLDPQQILPSPHTIPHRRTYARLFFWLLSPQLLLSYVKTPPSITPNVRATLNPGHRFIHSSDGKNEVQGDRLL